MMNLRLSLTRDQRLAEIWSRKAGTEVAVIDLDAISQERIIDLSTGPGRMAHLGDVTRAPPDSPLHEANKMARGAKEILVDGAVSQSALRKRCSC